MLPPLVVGQRFLVPEIRNLPAVELVRKSTTTWIVAEIKHDGTTDSWTFRIDKPTLAGKRVVILPPEYRPHFGSGSTLPPIPETGKTSDS